MTADESRDAQSGVAEVLAETARDHSIRSCLPTGLMRFNIACRCGERLFDVDLDAHVAHVAAIQAAAISPLLAAERAKAWDEGCSAAYENQARTIYGDGPQITNPYADREQP